MGTEGAVNIVNFSNSYGIFNSFLNLGSKLFLSADKLDNLFSSLFNIAKIVKSLLKFTKNLVIKRARNFFSITRNKGDCISLVNKLNGLFNLCECNIQFLCKCFKNVHLYVSNCSISFFVKNLHSPRAKLSSNTRGPKVTLSR